MLSRRSFVGSAVAAFACWPNSIWADEQTLVKFGVVSDPHLTVRPESADALRQAFARFSREGVRAVVIAGDLCDVGTLPELANLTSAWTESFPGGKNALGESVEPIVAFGNHDYHDRDYFEAKGFPKSLSEKGILFCKDVAWLMITGRAFEGEIYRRDICGVAFLAAHWSHYDDELAVWLREHAAEIPKDRPVFFVQHSHPYETCFGKWYKSSSKTNLSVLLDHPNFFVISGHSHIANTFEDALWQGGFVSMAAGCVGGSGGRRYEYNVGIRPDEVAARGTRHMPPHDAGLAKLSSIVTVYPSRVTVSRWDHRFEEPAGDVWNIPFPFRHDRDHPFIVAESASPAEFERGASIEISQMDGVLHPLNAPEPQIRLSFPCAVGVGTHSRVVDYRVVISRRDGGGVVAERLCAQPKATLAERHALLEGGCCIFGRQEIPSNVRLVAKVTPLDAAGKAGMPLTKEFTI